jgi:hypothetical protein
MADTLEDFLTTIRRDLAPLPFEQRERLLDAVSVQLARDMSAGLEQGLDEDAAALEAVRKFDICHRSALNSHITQSHRFGSFLTPLVVDALYCAISGKLIALAIGFLLWLIASPFLPSYTPATWVAAGAGSIEPSLLIAILAGILLLFRDGLPAMVTTLTSSQTVPGTGARWNILKNVFLSVLTLLLILLFRSAAEAGTISLATVLESPAQLVLGLAIILLMPASFYLAGWLVARASPSAGLSGVRAASVTSGLISFLDQCWWQSESGNDLPFSLRAALVVFMLLGQGLLAGLAIAGARIGSQDATPQS